MESVNGGHFGIPVNKVGQMNGTEVNGPSPQQQNQAQMQMQMQMQMQTQMQMKGGPVNQQQQSQQKQKLLMQQRLLQHKKQQQANQNFELKFNQLLVTLNKNPKRLYNFVEDTDSILKKYEQYRPSFEFHIYENSYKLCAPANTRLQQKQKAPEMSADGLILNKNNPVLKEFLEYVARGQIPEAIMEVLRDCNIQFYEGNLILQVYDHTNTVDIKIRENPQANAATNTNRDTQARNPNQPQPNVRSPPQVQNAQASPGQTVQPSNAVNSSTPGGIDNNERQNSVNSTNAAANNKSADTSESTQNNVKSPLPPGTPNADNKSQASPINNPQSEMPGKPAAAAKPKTFKRPRVYRTLLRPSDLSNYHDMMASADTTRFSDNIYQQLESEILSLTKRNLDLEVPMNPYKYQDFLEEENFIKPKKDEKANKYTYYHRDESTKPGTRGAEGHVEQHEELPQHSSNYEQIMLIMDEKTVTSTNSTLAIALTKKALMNSNGNNRLPNSRNQTADDYADNKLMSGSGDFSGKDSNNKVAIAAAAAAAAVEANGRNEANQFSRIKFIEQWKHNMERRSNSPMDQGMIANSLNNRISMTAPQSAQQQAFHQQQQQFLQQQQMLQQQQQQSQVQKAVSGVKRTTNQGNDKPKAKKARKPTKKPVPDAGAAKKKKPTKKKQADTNNMS